MPDTSRLGPEGQKILADMRAALGSDDAALLRGLLSRYPALTAMLDEPIGPADAPPIIYVKSTALLDVLLEAGADINARSTWWAGGFGVLDWAPLDVAAYAIERGARVTIHAAARLGLIDRLEAFVAQDAALVHARGGDGQTPLHMASSVEAADVLLDAGAALDAKDVDHESTPAQYMVGERQVVARHLVAKGCHTDLLMAAALGDLDLTRLHLDADPRSIRMRVDSHWFPMVNPKAGGTIYNWTLGWYASAHEVARKFGREEILSLLYERTPPTLRVIEACCIEDEAAVRRFRADTPDLAGTLADAERRRLPDAARNNRTTAVRLMLECGLPVSTGGQHNGTSLHWAAFHGNASMIQEILRFKPDLEATDNEFNATPLGWAIHGSEHGWYAQTGDYAKTVELLLQAGAKRPAAAAGSAAVREVLAAQA
jgi:ankyrin repeat protein